tara:strand:- start:19776 stop:20636 length:861 start_codon:yes stop_codon:yes gene_type:complete
MRDLISTDLFTGVEETIRTGLSHLLQQGQRISLISDANLLGALSIAPLEASLIDSNLPYRRRIGNIDNTVPRNSILIHNDGNVKGVSWNNEKKVLSISETLSPALSGHLGDDKIGPLTTVAICHSIAQLISPSGVLVRKIRPWAISGNWIHSCMDMTYDPVYVSMKELLTLEGTIRVIPIPEVPSPNVDSLDFIDENSLSDISDRWSSMGEEGRARSLSHLCRGALDSSSPSTSRLEEIVWNCILASGWKVDLASQIRASSIIWEEKNPKIATSEAIDMLLRSGRL